MRPGFHAEPASRQSANERENPQRSHGVLLSHLGCFKTPSSVGEAQRAGAAARTYVLDTLPAT